MNRLLALTDFSAAAEAALRYAAALALAQKLPLSVLHRPVTPVPMPFTGPDEMLLPPLPVVPPPSDSGDQLAESVARLQAEFPDLVVDGRLVFGLSDAAAADSGSVPEGAHTMVVANGVAGGGRETWLDADLSDLLRTADRTVVAVAPGYRYRPVRAIGLALDPAAEPDAALLAPLGDWLQQTGARLHVVCVVRDAKPLPERRIAALEAFAPQYHQVTDASTLESGLQELVELLALDWLAVVPHSHGLVGDLFHKDHLPALARACSVPLVALHGPAQAL